MKWHIKKKINEDIRYETNYNIDYFKKKIKKIVGVLWTRNFILHLN